MMQFQIEADYFTCYCTTLWDCNKDIKTSFCFVGEYKSVLDFVQLHLATKLSVYSVFTTCTVLKAYTSKTIYLFGCAFPSPNACLWRFHRDLQKLQKQAFAGNMVFQHINCERIIKANTRQRDVKSQTSRSLGSFCQHMHVLFCLTSVQIDSPITVYYYPLQVFQAF